MSYSFLLAVAIWPFWEAGEGALVIMLSRSLYGHRPSNAYTAGTERVGFSPTRQALLTPRLERPEVLGESHGG